MNKLLLFSLTICLLCTTDVFCASAPSQEGLAQKIRAAIKTKDKDQVAAVLDAKFDINTPYFGEGRTAISQAAQFGTPEIIQLLALRKADINQPDKNGWTPLHVIGIASEKNVETLLALKADASKCDNEGETPLAILISLGRYNSTVEALQRDLAKINLLYKAEKEQWEKKSKEESKKPDVEEA